MDNKPVLFVFQQKRLARECFSSIEEQRKTFDLCKELNIDPLSAAMNGGEDYRLLFTIPIGKHDKFRHDFQTFDIIGHLAKPEVGAAMVTPDGVELPVKAQGWI